MASQRVFGSIADLAAGDHVCFIYDEPEAALAVGAQLLARGLARGEHALYITGDHPIERAEAALASVGVDVARERGRGTLVLQPTWRDAFPRGEFDPEEMAAFIARLVGDVRARGFSGIWVAADMTWAVRMGVPHDRLVRYEALLHETFARNPLVAICAYNRRDLRPCALREALHAHPLALLEDVVCPNLYYEPPEPVLDEEEAAAEVEWMLAQIGRALRAEREHTALLQEHVAHVGAESARRQLQEFLAMVAHDLANPLTSVQGYAQVLRRHAERARRDDGSEIARREREALAHLEDAAGRMRRLVDDLRDAARIGAGQFGVRRAPTDLVAVARQVAAELQATTRRHWIVVEAPARLEGRWDRDRVGQLLTNLVANAIRYAPDGGPIRIGLARRDDEAVLSVRDEGIGMSPEQIERLFRAFSRVHPDQPAQGLGLGLCIAKAIVDGHGGRIWVESAPGKGTTVSAALPIGGERPEDARDPSTDDAGWQPAA